LIERFSPGVDVGLMIALLLSEDHRRVNGQRIAAPGGVAV
jgi:hypothetical protein